jgi:DNA-binding MarR family transcriptional regulator
MPPARPDAISTSPDRPLRWPDAEADAWLGLLATHRRLTRELDAELEAEHGLSASELGVLTRLAGSPEGRMRLSALAEDCDLSLSRVSRVVDALEARELVQRRPCPSDARAINAHLTPAGRTLALAAQATHFVGVRERFLDRLSESELHALGTIFTRLAGDERARVDEDSCPSGA